MPDGNQITANAADGTQHIFPAGTDMAVVDGVMKRYASARQPGAFQQRKGGPILNTKDLAAPEEGPTLGSTARSAATGATSAIIPEGAQSTSGRANLSTIGQGLNEQVNTAATTPWGQGGPLWGVISMLAKGLMGGAHGAASGVEEMGSGAWNKDTDKVAHGGGALLGNLATLGLLKENPAEAGPSITSRGKFTIGDPFDRNSLKNLSNAGPEKASFIERQVGKGNAVQQHVKGVLDAVYADGQQQMGGVSKTIDSAEPKGAFDKAQVQGAVKDAMGVVKADQKVPAAISKILDDGKVTRTTGPSVGGKTIDLSDPAQLKMYQKLKAQGALSPEEVKRMEGGPSEDKFSFEQLKQLHSELGKQIANTDGAVESGVKTAYGKLSEMLRNKAESHGLLNEWQQGTAKIKGYYDAVYRSPLKSTYFGQNHGEIMKPFVSDDTAPQVNQILQKYTPYGIDLDKLQDTAGAYKYGEQWDKMSNPSKRMAIVAAISPKTAAGMIYAPRGMRSRFATNYQFPNQLKEVPNVAPEKIYPSSKAAAKAATKGNP